MVGRCILCCASKHARTYQYNNVNWTSSVYSNSTKQRLVSCCSMESELIGVHDALPQILWTCSFLMAWGYDIMDNALYQDNKSAILLEEHGRKLSMKCTKHIAIHYFFMHDCIQNKELCVLYCPTDMILRDYFTKPLQDTLFH